MDIDEESEGELFDHCITSWENIGNKPAERYNALRIMIKISEKYPELIVEINSLTNESYLQNLADGTKRVIIKSIKKLNKKHNFEPLN
ncbi:MAG: hypothetical protein R2771_06115 [Saprospiraceae bacterium]